MKKFCEKKYVLFDFDGVIADTEESNGNYLGLALKEFGVELTQKDRDRLIGSHDSHILLGLGTLAGENNNGTAFAKKKRNRKYI